MENFSPTGYTLCLGLGDQLFSDTVLPHLSFSISSAIWLYLSYLNSQLPWKKIPFFASPTQHNIIVRTWPPTLWMHNVLKDSASDKQFFTLAADSRPTSSSSSTTTSSSSPSCSKNVLGSLLNQISSDVSQPNPTWSDSWPASRALRIVGNNQTLGLWSLPGALLSVLLDDGCGDSYSNRDCD